MASKPFVNAIRVEEFYDTLADLVLSMPVEDIRNEMKEEGLNPDFEITKTRKRLLDSLAHSQAYEITDAVSSLLRKTAKAVTDIVSAPMGVREKRHLLEVTFAKASTESELDMSKVVEALNGLTDQEKQLLNEAIGNLIRKK